MKNLALALVALVSVGALTGCGKSKNQSNNNNGGPIVGLPGPSLPGPTGNGGCYTVPMNGNSGITLSFSGQATSVSSGIRASLQVAGFGGSTSSQYYRSNYLGDSLQVTVSGNTVYATANLSASAVSLVAVRGGQICGLYIDANIYNPAVNGWAWSGNIGGGTIAIIGAGGSNTGVIL
jgi:hypothetical protein